MVLIREKGYVVVNADTSLCLQTPKIATYIPDMVREMSSRLGVNEEDVSVKATTAEKLGFVGREEGVVAYATVLLRKEKQVV
jgi:2-C-methyl-D-erythritol 2,4-cyclodiphosphate synthase